MCRCRALFPRLLGIPVLLLGTLLAAQNAYAVQASGAIQLLPTENNLTLNSNFQMPIVVVNTSSETGAEGFGPVPASLVAGGQITVTLACENSTCAVELPNTLQLLSCPAVHANVGTCTQVGDNSVEITIANDIVIPAGGNVQVAVLDLNPETPVLVPDTGNFSMRGSTGPDDLSAESIANPALDPVTGSAAGSTSFLFPGVCEVQIDKQISCDDGVTWFDDNGLQIGDEDGHAPPCVALDGTEILVRYQVQNTGDIDVFGCELDDSNDDFDNGSPIMLGDLTVGQVWPSDGHSPAPGSAICSDDLELAEPNTATVTCDCAEPDSGDEVSAFDLADVECLGPMYSISKTCDDAAVGTEGDGESLVTVTFEAIGSDVDIICDISDDLYYEDTDCTDGVSGPSVNLITEPNATVTAGGSIDFTEVTGALVADACNKVTATNCRAVVDSQEIPLEDPLDMDMDDALCPGAPPEVNVVKICEDDQLGAIDDGMSKVTVTVSAPASNVVPVECDVDDDIYLSDPICSDGVDGDSVKLIDDIATVAPGGSQDFMANVGDGSAGIDPLMMAACNKGTISNCVAQSQFGDVPLVPSMMMSTDECPGQPMFCRLTGGGVTTDGTWDGTLMRGKDGDTSNRYTFGGQVGANTALPPQPAGEWQHNQKRGPFGRFGFHAGTASAPAGTEIIAIRCSDPGGCAPSGNPPSPNKQLDFDCVGTFRNIAKGSRAPTWLIAGATATAEGNGNQNFDGTFHYCQVNVDDNGEGPDPAKGDNAACPPDGFGEKAVTPLSNCDCPDFYRITIYDGVNAADVTFLPDGSIDLTTLNTMDVIYEVEGYLGKGGNGLQLHDLTGFDRK